MKKSVLIILMMILALALYSCSSTEAETINVEVVENTVTEVETKEVMAAEEVVEVSDDNSNQTLEKGKVVPDYDMYDLDGNLVKLSDYRGKIVMLNFWATWCTYCDQEMPDLNAVDKEDDVVVLAVNVQEPKGLVVDYLTEGGYTFDVVLDESGDIANEFMITSFPTTFFISSEGVLLGSVPGMMELDKMNLILQDIRDGIIK